MHHHIVHRHRRLRAVAAAAALFVLSACGGGGTSTSAPVVASTLITGNVGNGSGAPVADATVSLGTTSGTPATTQTDTNGNFTLPVPTSNVNTNTVVVVTVAKEGFKSCTGTVSLTDGAVAGCSTLTPAALGELHPATADAVLVRLGDGEAAGAANSRLQIAVPFGLSKTVALGWPANFNLAGFQTFTVNLDIRGMQLFEFNCADKITVLQGATAETATAVQTFSAANANLPDGDLQGAFSAYALPVPTSQLAAAGGNLYVKLEAGLCAGGTPADPSDDFEFVGLYGKFS